jgi:hypothetical protein
MFKLINLLELASTCDDLLDLTGDDRKHDLLDPNGKGSKHDLIDLSGNDSISVIKSNLQPQNNTKPIYYYIGTRLGQILHARLRMQCI